MNHNIYRTRDLGESAALITSKQQLLEIERVGKVCWFIFANPQTCKEISTKYFFGNLLLSARDYYESLTRLKNRIFAGR